MAENTAERFLIINPFGIGDVLFTTPVIRALKKKYPGCFIGYWCNERVSALLKNSPDIDRIFALSRGDIKRIYKGRPLKGIAVLLKLIKEIKGEHFGAAFDFSLDSRYGFWSKSAGIKKRIGFDYKNRGRFLTDRIRLEGYSGKHVVEYYAGLLKFIGIEPEDKSLYLAVSGENRSKAKGRLLKSGIEPASPVVGIAPGGGASWGNDAIYKQWPAEKFGQLAARLIKDQEKRVVLLGSADDKPLAGIICGYDDRIVDLTGKLGLEEAAAVVKELKLLVCNDGGPLHMAASLGVKTVSIFGPVDEKVYGPYPPGEKHGVVKKDLPCRPCYKNFRFNGCFNGRRCLKDVTVDEVYEKVKTLLCAAT